MTKKNHILTSHPEAFAEGSGERFFAFAQNDKVRDCRATLAMTEQRGRSMVEMLGVLAVIGVLSVAGIAGYSIAMRSYRINEIVNAASMFYVLAKSQNQGNGPSGNIAYADVGGTNPSGASLTYTNNAFTITFTDTDDCTMAENKLGDKATADCSNKKITVNFGETTTSEEPALLDNTEWYQESCPDGYAFIVSMSGDGCARSLEEADEYCKSGGAVYDTTVQQGGYSEKKYFHCEF